MDVTENRVDVEYGQVIDASMFDMVRKMHTELVHIGHGTIIPASVIKYEGIDYCPLIDVIIFDGDKVIGRSIVEDESVYCVDSMALSTLALNDPKRVENLIRERLHIQVKNLRLDGIPITKTVTKVKFGIATVTRYMTFIVCCDYAGEDKDVKWKDGVEYLDGYQQKAAYTYKALKSTCRNTRY